MKNGIKIIATIGPASAKPEVLEKLKDRGVDFFRINLSHTDEQEITANISLLQPYGIPIILDTEGHQVRSGNTTEINFKDGDNVRIYKKKIECNSKNIFLNPPEVIGNLQEGDLIAIDFNSLLMKVFDTSNLEKEGYITCKVLIGGSIGGKKAVYIDSPSLKLFSFSKKDLIALDLAKKHGIKHFTLSFMESGDPVREFRSLYPEATLYSKIESQKGLENVLDILRESDGVLVDRGDMSSQVPLEKIPLVQKYIVKKAREMGKQAFIATDTLGEMANSLKPNRAEVNDIVNTILDGVSGFALTKEIATGKYPVETVNMVKTLIKQVNLLANKADFNIDKLMEEMNYKTSEKVSDLLIAPHGGKLVNRVYNGTYNKLDLPKKEIKINKETLMDVEQIAIGGFSPIEGFMCQKDFEGMVNHMKLSNGVVWTLPIVLAVNEQMKNQLKVGDKVSLRFKEDNEIYAILDIEDIYKPDKKQSAKKIFGTLDLEHPGVKNFLELDDYFLGGKITLLKRRSSPHKIYELTPKQTRKIFAERGWSRVLGFHTRNVIHRSHEFIQRQGMKKGACDGLLLHPVIGKKKQGDFESHVIMDAYEKMIELFYEKSRALLCSLATYSRYCGPREAIFTALVRKNYGCSHFVVGRDHTGVKDFYHPKASHEIFDKFSKQELGITPIKFDKVFYSQIKKGYLHEPENQDHPEDQKLHISGTQAREMLQTGKRPPEWFMRPEISRVILQKIASGEPVFVETVEQIEKTTSKVLWFTGLSGSGKTTIAERLKNKLESNGKKIKILDGDIVRNKIHKHLGFTPEDIHENNKLIAKLCKQELENFDYILVPIISPFKKSRQEAQKILGKSFVEVHINCPLKKCIQKDVKGLYKKALAGEITDFIGIARQNPYQPPKKPHIKVNTHLESVEQSVNRILGFLK